MGSCYSVDHFAEDDLHTDITICNIEELQQKYRLGMVSNRLLGAGGEGFKHVLLDPNFALSDVSVCLNILIHVSYFCFVQRKRMICHRRKQKHSSFKYF